MLTNQSLLLRQTGRCLESRHCDCEEGWRGEDCSISTLISPNAEVESCCDANGDPPCNMLAVMSEGFDADSTYSCQLLNVSTVKSHLQAHALIVLCACIVREFSYKLML